MDNQYQPLAVGEMVIDPTDDKYETVPDGEMLKMHIASVQKVEADNFDRTGKETKLAVGFELDEDIPGKGQVYTQWFTPSLNPKSNLAKLSVAIFGEIKGFDPATDLPGQPLRISLKNKEKDGVVKQYVDGFFKPDKDQKVVSVQQKETDDIMDLSEEDLSKVFPE